VSTLHAIVLGITQGLSEFLPISSSGHLVVVPWLFGWDDFAGDPSLEKTFDVALHLGTLVAAVAYFRADLVRYVIAASTRAGRRTADGRVAGLLVVATIPAAVTGALFSGVIEENTGAIPLVATMSIVFGLVLAWADRMAGARPLEEARLRDALLIGAGQATALQPGVSRSGVTMTVGRFMGLSRDGAARFAFLMSIPITAGALLFKGADVAGDGIPDGFAAAFFWGIVAAGVTGWVAVWGTLKLVRTHTFLPFVIYRVVAGVLVLVVYAGR
jgi:undecaprenyl-diphosphatase